jgi:hypothetical protein
MSDKPSIPPDFWKNIITKADGGYRPKGPAIDPENVFQAGQQASAAEPPPAQIGGPWTLDRHLIGTEGVANTSRRLQEAKLYDTLQQARTAWRAEGVSDAVIDMATEKLRALILRGECPLYDGTVYERGLPKGFDSLGIIRR